MPLDQRSPIAVCTLWEGDYHKGLATLVNSLHRAGFKGNVWAGYRGPLPPWALGGVTDGVVHTVMPAPGLQVCFVALETTLHFSQFKPQFCRRILQQLDPTAAGVYYFDPDIFVLAEWTFFEQWLQLGVVGCEDSHYPLNPTHPIVAALATVAAKLGVELQKRPEAYLNSGLVGLKQEHLSFLDEWQLFMDAGRRDWGVEGVLGFGSRANLFHNPDQDAFSLATWTTPHPVSWVGVDGMGFARGEWLVLHATAAKKPWRRRAVRDLLMEGLRPDSASRLYWELAGSPIQVEPASRIKQHRWLVPLAAGLGRFYRRG